MLRVRRSQPLLGYLLGGSYCYISSLFLPNLLSAACVSHRCPISGLSRQAETLRKPQSASQGIQIQLFSDLAMVPLYSLE